MENLYPIFDNCINQCYWCSNCWFQSWQERNWTLLFQAVWLVTRYPRQFRCIESRSRVGAISARFLRLPKDCSTPFRQLDYRCVCLSIAPQLPFLHHMHCNLKTRCILFFLFLSGRALAPEPCCLTIGVKNLSITGSPQFSLCLQIAVYLLPNRCLEIQESDGVRKTGFTSPNIPHICCFPIDLSELLCELLVTTPCILSCTRLRAHCTDNTKAYRYLPWSELAAKFLLLHLNPTYYRRINEHRPNNKNITTWGLNSYVVAKFCLYGAYKLWLHVLSLPSRVYSKEPSYLK